MLTRRTLRIKAMQYLYAFYMQKKSLATWDGREATYKLLTALEQDIDQLQRLHCQLLQLMLLWAVLDEEDEKARFRPYARHLNSNQFICQLRADATWRQLSQRYPIACPEAQLQLWFYTDVEASPLLLTYKERNSVNPAIESRLIEAILKKHIFRHTAIQAYVEDLFLDMGPYKPFFERALCAFVKQFMRKDPQSFSFYKKDAFAGQAYFYSQMVENILRGEQAYEARIEQHARNWAIGRMPLLDQVLLKMGLAEQTCFRDIPRRVTLNEYVELAKAYSTPDSYRFINGVLEAMLGKPVA